MDPKVVKYNWMNEYQNFVYHELCNILSCYDLNQIGEKLLFSNPYEDIVNALSCPLNCKMLLSISKIYKEKNLCLEKTKNEILTIKKDILLILNKIKLTSF